MKKTIKTATGNRQPAIDNRQQVIGDRQTATGIKTATAFVAIVAALALAAPAWRRRKAILRPSRTTTTSSSRAICQTARKQAGGDVGNLFDLDERPDGRPQGARASTTC